MAYLSRTLFWEVGEVAWGLAIVVLLIRATGAFLTFLLVPPPCNLVMLVGGTWVVIIEIYIIHRLDPYLSEQKVYK